MKKFVLLAALGLVACREPEPGKTETQGANPVTSAATKAPAPASATVQSSATPVAAPGEIAWDAPANWASMPNASAMRKATYRIPKAGGDSEDAELSVIIASGGVAPNVKRWEQQFGDAKATTEERKPNGLKVTLVEIKGTFAGGGMMGGPSGAKPGQMLLGAIIDSGEQQHFFKMTGGEKTVTAAKKDFDKFVASFRTK